MGEPGFGGSHTPSMVGAVQAWRKRDPEKAKTVWAALAEANLSVEKGLLLLKDAAQSEDSYMSTLQACSTSTADQVDSGHFILALVLNWQVRKTLSRRNSVLFLARCSRYRYWFNLNHVVLIPCTWLTSAISLETSHQLAGSIVAV